MGGAQLNETIEFSAISRAVTLRTFSCSIVDGLGCSACPAHGEEPHGEVNISWAERHAVYSVRAAQCYRDCCAFR